MAKTAWPHSKAPDSRPDEYAYRVAYHLRQQGLARLTAEWFTFRRLRHVMEQHRLKVSPAVTAANMGGEWPSSPECREYKAMRAEVKS